MAKPVKKRWFRATLHTGLCVGMLAQLPLLFWLKTIGLFPNNSSSESLSHTATLVVIAAVAWSVALLSGRFWQKTLASVAGCALTLAYYVGSESWSWFAMQQHPAVYWLPLLALVLVALPLAFYDSVLSLIHLPQYATPWVVPLVYCLAAGLLAAHPVLFRWNYSPPATAVPYGWPTVAWHWNFNLLPQLAAVGLVIAAAVRSRSIHISGLMALFGTVAGCVYGSLSCERFYTFVKLGHPPVTNQTGLAPFVVSTVALGLSLFPLLITFFYSVLDLRKDESARRILLRGAAILCFAVFIASVHLQFRLRDLAQWDLVIFASAYLLCAFHPKSWYSFVLGTSLGQVFLVVRNFLPILARSPVITVRYLTFYLPAGDVSVAIAAMAANVALLGTLLATAIEKDEQIRPFMMITGLICLFVLAVGLFLSFLLVPWW